VPDRTEHAPLYLRDLRTFFGEEPVDARVAVGNPRGVDYSLVRAKKLPRAAECLVYSLTTERGFGGKPPKKSGFRRHLAGSKMPQEGSKMPKETFFTAISRWRVVSRRALDAPGFWQG